MRNLIIVCLVVLITLVVLPTLHSAANSKTINVDEQKVVYPLPYPGILSDHPLYVFKSIRDSILVFTTRDTLKKAQLYHHLSDKHIAMAVQLAEKGKEQLAVKELTTAEDLFLIIPPLLKESKKQGVAPTNDFIMELYQSNAKHEELITDVMKTTTQANVQTLNGLLKKNEQVRKSLGKI